MGAMREKVTLTAAQVVKCLATKHTPPEWAAFTELCTSTGVAQQRIDLFAMHCYPSEHFRTVGYEVKISRSDFMRELENPQKHSFLDSVASERYFAAPAGLILKDEVPDGWGLREVHANGTVVTRKAARQTFPAPPLPPSFVASIARRSAETAPPLSAFWYTYNGQTLTDEDLLKIAGEVYHRTIEQHRESWARAAVSDFRNSNEYSAMNRAMSAFRSITGQHEPTYESIEAWAREQRGAPDPAIGHLVKILSDEQARVQNTLARLQAAITKQGIVT